MSTGEHEKRGGVTCLRCIRWRVGVAALVLGAGAGFGSHALGLGDVEGMTATFLGAIGPILWYARRRAS